MNDELNQLRALANYNQTLLYKAMILALGEADKLKMDYVPYEWIAALILEYKDDE